MTRHAILFLALVVASGCSDGSSDDSGEPGDITLEVTSPMPGAELLEADAPAILVIGTAATTSPDGTLEVWVNGDSVPIESDGSFAAELTPAFGVNHVQVEALDGLSEAVEHRMDVLWAPDYLAPLEGTTGFDLPDSVELRLGQRFLDSQLVGSDLDLAADPVVAENLAHVVEMVLWNMDLAGLLAGGIHVGGEGGATLDVDIPSTEVQGEVLADVEIFDGPVTGVELHVDLIGIYLDMDGVFAFGGDEWIIDGGLVADMHASAQVTIELGDDGQVAVAVSDITATVGPLSPQFVGADGDELNAFIALNDSNFRGIIETLITDELVPTITDGLPALFGTLLSAVDELFSDVSFALDAGLGATVATAIDSEISAFEVVAGPPIGIAPGHLTVRQDLSIATAGEPIHPDSRGAARVTATPSLPFTNAGGLHLAIRQDFLNALLHALWNTGLIDGTAVIGELDAEVRAQLPPVVRDVPLVSTCTIEGERCDVILQLGQLEIDLVEFEQRFVVSASAGARILVVDGQVSVVVQETPEILVWETTNAPPGSLTPEAVEEVILRLVWPDLVTAITENLRFQLPLPNLTDLGLDVVAPDLAGVPVTLVTRQRPTVAAGYLGLSADIELAAPPAP